MAWTIASAVDERPPAAIGRREIAVAAACSLAYFLDQSGVAVGGAFPALFVHAGGAFGSDGLPWLVSSPFAGAAVGVPFLGLLARRRGGRAGLVAALLILAATSLAEALSPDITTLAAARFLSGAALGGIPPLAFALIANEFPRDRRGAAAMSVSVVGLAAVPATFFAVLWLTPLHPAGFDAWRWVVAAGGAASILCGAAFWLMPEARAQPETPAAGAHSDRGLIRDRAHRRPLAWLAILSVLTPWGTIGFALIGGAVMRAKGFDAGNSLLYLGLSFLGPIASSLGAALVIERLGRRSVMIISAVAVAVLSPLSAFLGSFFWLAVAGIAITTAASTYIPVFLLSAAEEFPPSLRAEANAWGWAVNRATTAVVPLVLLPLLGLGGPLAVFGLMSLTMLAIIAMVASSPRFGSAWS